MQFTVDTYFGMYAADNATSFISELIYQLQIICHLWVGIKRNLFTSRKKLTAWWDRMTSLNTSSKGYSYYGTADPIFSLSTRLDLSGVPAALLDISSLSALKMKKINKHFKSEKKFFFHIMSCRTLPLLLASHKLLGYHCNFVTVLALGDCSPRSYPFHSAIGVVQ